MSRVRKKLWVVCGLSVLLVIGTTLAVWHQHIQHTNHLEADTIKAQVVENFTPSEPKDTVTKDVSFKNEGTTDVFVRVAYVENAGSISELWRCGLLSVFQSRDATGKHRGCNVE